MADTKLTGLAAGTPLATDVVYFVSDPGGTPVSKKATVSSLAGGTLPTSPVGQVLVSQGAGVTPVFRSIVTLLDQSGAANLRRWELKIVGGDLQIDSQNDAGVSYSRPVVISLFNGGIQLTGNVVTQNQVGANSLNLSELPFANAPAGPNLGHLANFNNSTVNTFGAVIAGGGTFHVLARWNGTNWICIGV
jgi:hypothetical protein